MPSDFIPDSIDNFFLKFFTQIMKIEYN